MGGRQHEYLHAASRRVNAPPAIPQVDLTELVHCSTSSVVPLDNQVQERPCGEDQGYVLAELDKAIPITRLSRLALSDIA